MTLQANGRAIKWRAVFAESAFIGASIILAFALQDWDEASDIEERTQIALCNVKSELAFNRFLLKNDYIPRQQGMLASVNGAIRILNSQPQTELTRSNLEQMLVQESLRYSAWSLAGESGYLIHANFELATEIGSLFDYQADSYQPLVNRINDAIFDRSLKYNEQPIEYYISLGGLLAEWTAQTNYLDQKYETLFNSANFVQLDCQE